MKLKRLIMSFLRYPFLHHLALGKIDTVRVRALKFRLVSEFSSFSVIHRRPIVCEQKKARNRSLPLLLFAASRRQIHFAAAMTAIFVCKHIFIENETEVSLRRRPRRYRL